MVGQKEWKSAYNLLPQIICINVQRKRTDYTTLLHINFTNVQRERKYLYSYSASITVYKTRGTVTVFSYTH